MAPVFFFRLSQYLFITGHNPPVSQPKLADISKGTNITLTQPWESLLQATDFPPLAARSIRHFFNPSLLTEHIQSFNNSTFSSADKTTYSGMGKWLLHLSNIFHPVTTMQMPTCRCKRGINIPIQTPIDQNNFNMSTVTDITSIQQSP